MCNELDLTKPVRYRNQHKTTLELIKSDVDGDCPLLFLAKRDSGSYYLVPRHKDGYVYRAEPNGRQSTNSFDIINVPEPNVVKYIHTYINKEGYISTICTKDNVITGQYFFSDVVTKIEIDPVTYKIVEASLVQPPSEEEK